MRLFTRNEPSVLTSKVESRFIREGIELRTSFVSPRRLNTEPLNFWEDVFEGSIPFLILLNTEGFGCAPILVKTDARLVELDDCNLSNTEVLLLGGSSSFSLSSISSAEMC